MKPTDPLTIAAIVVIAGLAGVVWFELPKSQRKSSATRLAKLEQPSTPTRATAAERACAAMSVRANATSQPAPNPSAPDVVDLRASTPEADVATRSASIDDSTPKPDDGANAAQSDAAPSPDARIEPHSAPQPAMLALELRDSEGRPVRGPQVVARWRDGEVFREALGTQVGAGRVEFSEVLGNGAVLEARGAGLAPTVFGPLARGALARASLALTLPRASVLRGTTNARGAASLVAWPAGSQGLAARFELELDEDGAFTLDGVWSGPLEALLLDSEGRTSEVQSLPSTELRTHYETKPGLSVQGVVLDPAGQPLSGAHVDALAAHGGFGVVALGSTTTDSAGRFTLPQAPVDALVQVRAPGLAPCWSSAPSAGELLIRMSPRRALTVVLDGAAAGGGEWTLSAWGIDDLAAYSTSNGRLELEGLAPGPYSFALRGPDAAVRHFTYTLAPGGGGELVLRLR